MKTLNNPFNEAEAAHIKRLLKVHQTGNYSVLLDFDKSIIFSLMRDLGLNMEDTITICLRRYEEKALEANL